MANTVRWGIIGCGNIARHAVCPAISWAEGACLEAVASREADRAARLAGELGAARSHPTYEALLADPEVDAIYIGLPNGLHEEWTIRALEAGKHVLCEKSLALDPNAAGRMIAAADRSGLRLMEAYMYRHHPQWEVVRGLLSEGAIGTIRFLRAGLMGDLTGNPQDHRWTAELGAGALFDVTCYGVNVARFLIGSEPVAIKAMADLHLAGVDQTTAALLDFGEGTIALVNGSLNSFGSQHCEIVGTKGSIIVEKPFIPGWDPVKIRVKRAGGAEEIEVGGANHYLHMVEHFSRCVLDPARPLTPGENGGSQVKVLAGIVSATQGAMSPSSTQRV